MNLGFLARAGRAAVLLLLSSVSLALAAEASFDRSGEAASLYRRALEYDARNTIEGRRAAVSLLEQATLLAPDQAEYHLTLGRLYLRMGFLRQARARFERVERLKPDDSAAHFGLGLIWRRDYLKYLDRSSLQRSLDQFTEAARLRPELCDAWLHLVALLAEKSDFRAALAAAERAREADSSRAEGLLAEAHAAFRLGHVERADSVFRAAFPRLPKIIRERYEDIAPVASERDTAFLRRLPASEKPEFLRRFWKENDPDLSTVANEAQLEYWSRVTQAYLLFFDPQRPEWDERGEYYVRYGPPEGAVYNPVGTPLSYKYVTGPDYPLNVLVWSYPSLGMAVAMQDRTLNGYYLPPISRYPLFGREPDPVILAARDDAIATSGGRGVFPRLPPGVKPLPVDGVIARFEGESAPRLLGLVQAPGSPGDSLWAEWVVIDSTRREIARASRSLSPSACDPAALRTADFSAELPPGDYIAGLSVRGPDGRRGVLRSPVRLEPPGERLAVSDVVLSCGAPEIDSSPGAQPSIRLSANPAASIPREGPLTVYFEIYHLLASGDGLARLEFEYTVSSVLKDPRPWIQRVMTPRPVIPSISATRREEQVGTLRRQFVTVPVQSLPGGPYRLEIRVRDLVAGTEAVQIRDFYKLGYFE